MKNDHSVALDALKEKIDEIIDITTSIQKVGNPIDRVMKALILQENQSMSDFADLQRIKRELNEAFCHILDYALKLEIRVESINGFIDNIEAAKHTYK